MYLGLTLIELMEVVRTCDSIEIEECTPPYLRDFIATRLDDQFAALAKKIRAFDDRQIDSVCEYIKLTHQLIRKPERP
jgi:hypothetical protein